MGQEQGLGNAGIFECAKTRLRALSFRALLPQKDRRSARRWAAERGPMLKVNSEAEPG